MIVLKHLANEFNLNPYTLRGQLRDKFGIRRRWRWDPQNAEDAKHLKKVRDYIKKEIADIPKSP